MTSRYVPFVKTLLTAVVCMALPLSLLGCQKTPQSNAVKTTDESGLTSLTTSFISVKPIIKTGKV